MNSTDGATAEVPVGIRRRSRDLGGPSDGLEFKRPTKRAAATAANHLARPLGGRPFRVYSTDHCRNNALRKDACSRPTPRETQPQCSISRWPLEEAGQRLDNYLHAAPHGRSPAAAFTALIRNGEVRVNGRRAGPEPRLQLHDRIRIPPVRLLPAGEPRHGPVRRSRTPIGQAIVYEDRSLLVLDKPAGVAVHGGSGVSFGVIEALRALRPGGAARAGASPRPRHERLPAHRAPRRRAAHAACAHARGRVREALSGAGAGPSGTSGPSASTCRCAPTRASGGERTVRASASGKTVAERIPPGAVLRQHGDAHGGDAAHRAHAPDPRARRSTPVTRWQGMRSTATRSSTTAHARRSALRACSCTPTA